MSEHGDLVKVVFEYEDGATSTLVSPKAQKWLEEVNDNILFNAARSGGSGISQYPWVWTGVKDDNTPAQKDQ